MGKTELFTLGNIYPSDFLKADEQPRFEPVELKLVMNDEGIVTLDKMAPKEAMWGERYWYRSGINFSMRRELKSIVKSILRVMSFKDNSVFLDIACNDGTLLSHVPFYFNKIGIDPIGGSFKEEAKEYGTIVQDYFSPSAYYSVTDKKASVITSIAMFYDIENPEEFIKGIYQIMDDEGIWVMQLSYSPLMIHQNAFDNICHEHYAYYTLSNLYRLLARGGFTIVDTKLSDANGGSVRLYIRKKIANPSLFGTQPYRDICSFRTQSILAYEQDRYYENSQTWRNWFHEIRKLRELTMSFIRKEKAKGKEIWGYGASTKGNTLLQFFGLDNTLLTAIAERNPDKWGLRTVGTNIPIKSEEDMRKANPDYLFIMPWHFIGEFKEREKSYLAGGGKFIVPCPKFEVI